jgi:hypothetical protein
MPARRRQYPLAHPDAPYHPEFYGELASKVAVVIARLRRGPATLAELARAIADDPLARIDARRAAHAMGLADDASVGCEVLAGWVVADLSDTEHVRGLTPDAEGRYWLPQGDIWRTKHEVDGTWVRSRYVDPPPAGKVLPALGDLYRNPFDPLGAWRGNLPHRVITEDDIDQLERSFHARGWQPDRGILVDERGLIIEGHARALMLERLGIDWRTATDDDGQPIYWEQRVYGTSPDANAQRILDAWLRNGRGLDEGTRKAVAEALTEAGKSVPYVAEVLGLTERTARRFTADVRRDRDRAMRDYAQGLAAEGGRTQVQIGQAVAAFFGGDAVPQPTIARWLGEPDVVSIPAIVAETDIDEGPGQPAEAEPPGFLAEMGARPVYDPTRQRQAGERELLIVRLVTEAGAAGMTTSEVDQAIGATSAASPILRRLVDRGTLRRGPGRFGRYYAPRHVPTTKPSEGLAEVRKLRPEPEPEPAEVLHVHRWICADCGAAWSAS